MRHAVPQQPCPQTIGTRRDIVYPMDSGSLQSLTSKECFSAGINIELESIPVASKVDIYSWQVCRFSTT